MNRGDGVARWVRLGLRLSVGSGRAGLVRTALMSAGAAIGVFLVLACLAAVSVAGAQRGRAEARTPVHTENASASLQIVVVEDAIGTRPLRRDVVAGVTADAPHPPGVAALPRPGEVVVSPALGTLMRTDPRAAHRFPQRVVGTIGPAGLVAPDELRAYVGVPADGPLLPDDGGFRSWPVTGFGDALQYPLGAANKWPDAFSPARFLAAAFALFVLVPYGVFLGTCARLSASTRDRRLAALRLLGVSARQATLVNAAETGVVAGGGALVGLAAFLALAPVSQDWRLGRLRWYAADVAVPAWLVVVVVTVTVLYAVAVGVAATRPARADPVAVRRDAPLGRPTAWRAAPFAVGLAAAAPAGGLGPDLGPDARGGLFLAAVLLVGLGLPLVVPLLGYGLADLVRRMPRTPVWLELATGRMRHAPGVAPRLVASLTVAVYVGGVAAVGLALFTDDRALVPAAGPSTGDPQLVRLSEVDEAVMSAVAAVPGVQPVEFVMVPATVGGEPTDLLVGDCADLTGMYSLPAGESCVDGRTYALDFSATGWWGPPARGAAVTETGVTVPAPTETLHPSMRWDMAQLAAGFVTRQAPVAATLPLSAGFVTRDAVVDDRTALDRVARIVSARTPAGAVEGDFGARQGFDTELLVTVLVAGLAVSFVLGIASFAAAAVDRTMERRRDNAALAVVGVSRRTATAGEVGFGALPLVIGLAVGVAATAAVAAALAGLLGSPAGAVADRLTPVLVLAAAALAVGLLLIAVPAWLTQRVTAEHLRRP